MKIKFMAIFMFASSFHSYSSECNDNKSLTEDVSQYSQILSEITNDACNETSKNEELSKILACIPNVLDTFEKTNNIDTKCKDLEKSYEGSAFLRRLIGLKKPTSSGKAAYIKAKKAKTNNAYGNAKKHLSTLTDFMMMDGYATNSSKEKIIREFQRNVSQLSAKLDCKPSKILVKRKLDKPLIIKHFKIGDRNPETNRLIRTDSDLRIALNAYSKTKEFKDKHEKLKKYKKKFGQTIWADRIVQSNCSTKVVQSSPKYYTRRSLPFPSCSGRVSINYANDSDAITPKSLSDLKNSEGFSKLKKCIDKYKAQNLKVKDIKIDGSANRFTGKNRPGQMKEATKYNKDLALRRAKSAESKVLEQLISGDLLSQYKSSGKKVKVTAKGEHGDGTSGPCPYSTKIGSDGKYQLKPEYQDKNSLKEHRYAKVKIIFDDMPARSLSESDKKTIRSNSAKIYCRSYTISCRE